MKITNKKSYARWLNPPADDSRWEKGFSSRQTNEMMIRVANIEAGDIISLRLPKRKVSRPILVESVEISGIETLRDTTLCAYNYAQAKSEIY